MGVRNERIEQRGLDDPDAQRLVAAFVDEIAPLYPGWGPGVGPTAEPGDFVPPEGCFLVAYVHGWAVGCGGVKRFAEGVGEIKRVYIAREARQCGLGRRLVSELESFAADAGYAVVRLDTGDQQPAALAMFRALGYREIEDYNGNPYAAYWFEKTVG